MSNKNPKHKKKITEEDLKKHLEERNKKVVEKDNIPTFKPKKKLEDQVVKKDPGTNIHRNKKGEVVIKDEEGVYKSYNPQQSEIKQGKKKSAKEYEKEQELIKEMQSNNLGLRAPLHYLANPDHMLGDFGNLTGFKPLQTFSNSDEDAQRYNFKSLDPSKSRSERFEDNLNEGLGLLPEASFNLALASFATKTPINALKEAYNPIPIPFNTGIKYDPTDYWKTAENNSDAVGLMESNNLIADYFPRRDINNVIGYNKLSETLPKEMEPYISKRMLNDTREQEIFESSFPVELQQLIREKRTQYLDSNGNVVDSPVNSASIPNPLALIDKSITRPPTPLQLLGMEDSWNNYSPLNYLPGYGKKLNAKGELYGYPGESQIFNNNVLSPKINIMEQTVSSPPVGFRKFGNSIKDVIESKTLRPNGSGMGSKQIKGEGNWAEPGKVNEHYSGVFEATMNPNVIGSDIRLQQMHRRNGVVGTTTDGDVAIPLTDPGLSFNRRLPFSNRYVPIDKEKLINNEFQLATQLPHLQSLTEKYGLYAGGAAGIGYISNGKEGAQENIKTLNKYTIDPIINNIQPLLENNKKTSQFTLGGNLQQQTNNNNMLNEFNEGGTHEQNPLGGIPQGMGKNGQMNTVEEGETKKDNFIYSDRIKLTPELVSQFNLPRVLANKTAAEATKIINTKFEGRNSTIDNSTKKAMLDRIAEAQETVKQIEAQKQAKIAEALNMNSTMAPEDQMNGEIPQGMEEFLPQQQMALGGFSDTLSSMGASGMLGQHTGINQLTTGVDLANTAFGKTGIDTSGATDVNPGSISVGGSALSGLTKGAQAGAMFGPWGIGIGAAVGGVAGLVGGNRAKKDAMKAHQNFQIGQSNKLVSNFAFGGNLIGEPVVGEPSTINTNIPITKEKLTTVNLKPEEPLVQPTSRNKKMIGLQSGVVNDKKGEGYYYYYDKKPGDPGFNPEEHRDFVTSENHSLGQRYLLSDGKVNPQYNYQLNNYLSQNKGFKYGGNMYDNGGYLNRFKTSRIEDNPNYQAQGPEGFFKTNIPRVGSSLPKKGQFYKESFNQMGQPQISNDLGFNSKLNYNDPDVVSLSPEQLQENNGAVTARTFGPQSNGHYEGEMYNGSKLEKVLNKTGQYLKDNYGNILRYSPVAMNALQLHKLNKSGYDTVNPMINNTRYNPQYMDEKALVNQINAESNYASNALANSSNGSMGTLRDNILASQLAKTKGLSDAYSRVAEVNRNENKTGQQFNLGVDEANIARRIAAEDKTAMNKGNWETNKSRLLGQIGTDLGNIGKEEVYKKLAKESFGYTWDGKYYVGPKGDKLTRQEMNSKIDSESNQNTTNQNRFGGYILNGSFLNNRMIKRYK